MQHRARPVDEQHPQVGIALLADRAEVPTLSRGVFARREAEVAGEVPPGGEPLDIAHRGDEGRRRQDTDAGNRAQPPDNQGRFGGRRQLALDGADTFLELADLADHLAERHAEQAGRAGVEVFEQGANVRHDMMRARRDHHAELAKDPALRNTGGGNSGSRLSGRSKSASNRSSDRPSCLLISVISNAGKIMPPANCLTCGSGENPRGKRFLSRISSADIAANCSHVTPPWSLTRTPCCTAFFPPDIITPWAGRFARS